MKQLSLKLLLVSLMVIPAMLTFAEKSVFFEDFSDGVCPPAGWSVVGSGQNNWMISNTNNAGGTASEGKFNWYPTVNGNSKMVSPEIATSGYTTLELEFKHYLDDFSGGYDLKVETTSDGGTTWNEVWSITPTGNIGSEILTIPIDNGDVGSDNFQFALIFDGVNNLNAWYFDDIEMSGSYSGTLFNVTYIVKDVNENLLEGAEIVMGDYGTLLTNASGEAVFADVEPGAYTYDITATNMEVYSGSVTVIDTDVNVDVVMEVGTAVVFSEDFTAGFCPPANWEVTPSGIGNWVINNGGGNAGGTGPEGKYYYFPPTTGTTRMITPEINTSAFATLELEFKHVLQGALNPNYSFKVETTSDGGSTWNEVWSVTPAGNIAQETVTISIENSDVGSPNFQFCLTYASTVSYGAWHYYFDDIILTGPMGGIDVYDVTYNVKDEDDNPIEDALITQDPYGTLSTDASGQAVFVDCATGTYSWDIDAGGSYIEQSGTVTVTDADVVVEVAMETLVPVFPFNEDFSNNAMPPEEWTIVGGGDDNWNTLNSSNAGGTAPEAAFAGTPGFNGNSKLVSPVLSSAGVLSLMLDFKHYVDDLAGSDYSFKVETTSDGGTTWNEVWSVSPTGNIGPEDVSILIENDDVGSENFQFAFTFDGNSSQINDWYFDDIHLDAALFANLIMEEFTTGDPFPPLGWNIPTGSANWGKSATSNAGGVASEIYVGWGPPYFTGTSRLESPTMSTYNYTSLKLQFNHFVWMNATYGYEYKVETSGDGGATWNEVWTITPTTDIDPEVVTLLIDNADVGSDNFKLAMTFEGNTGQINYWYMDNIYLTDGAASEVYPVTYFVKDADGNPIEGAAVNMEKNGLRYTDPLGQVTYNNVFPGTYACSISGYLFETETIEVAVTDAPVTVDVELGMSLVLLYESFQGVFPPTTWTTFGDGQSAWHKASANNAGGLAAPELMFLPPGTPFTGNSKLVSPEISTTAYTALFLDFKHTILHLDGEEYSVKVETTSDGGTTWNEVWSITPDGNTIQEAASILIENADVGSDIFQFAFTFEGNSAQIEKWYIDDVTLSAALAIDASVISIDMPDLAVTGDVLDPTASVQNTGFETVTFDVTFEIIEGTAVYSELVTVTDLAPLETEIVTFPAWTSITGNYDLEVSVDLVNDQNPTNDMLSQTLGVASGLVPKKALYEVFTSSTCPPCPAANEIIDGVLDNNPGAYTLIKYQMNWPGSGDPYYTEEGGVRRGYYGVLSVPDLYINSEQLSPPGSFTQAIFDEYALEETALSIDIIEASIDDENIVTVSVDLTSIIDYDEGLAAHIVVVEKLTTGNVGSNGELEFHYVMMKMMPDASGTTLSAITTGVPVTLTESFDMDDTNMEEADDLAVIVIVEDNTEKSVVQSAMSDIGGAALTYGNLEGIVTDADGGAAIEGATVMAGSNTATTGADGMYSFMDITTGTYEVTCTAAGYVGQTATAVVEEGQTTTTDFALVEESAPPVGEIVFEDDFESYTAGEMVACQNPEDWTTWANDPCGADDAYVSADQAYGGSNSVNIVTDDDLVLDLDEYLTAGKHTVSLMIYVPTGGDAYYNILSSFTPAQEWAFEVYFNAGGDAAVSAGGTAAATFNYAFDTWIESKVVVDLNADWAEYYVDGTLIIEWQWTAGASGAGNALQLGALDFFGATATTTYYFDDLKIETAEGLAAPTDLTATVVNGNDVELNWLGAAGTGGWIYWDQQENGGDGIGLTGGGTFNVASRWEPADLTPYDGMYLTQVSYYNYDNAPASEFVIKVWTGADAGTLVLEQTVVGSVVADWNMIVLDSPVMIDATDELWFGYEVTNQDGENPAGVDFGPALQFKGDMISLDGVAWVSMSSEYGLDYNWNLAGMVASSADCAVAQPLVKTVPSIISDASFVSAKQIGTAVEISANAKATKGFLGYNVYRNGAVIAEDVTVTNYTDYDLLPGTYTFDVKAVYDEGISSGAGPVEVVFWGGVDRELVIIEVATGTWCQFCPGAAMGVDEMHAEGLQVGVIEYHSGDGYETTESAARIAYYGITGFPTAVFDGVNQVVGGNATTSMYATYLPKYETRIGIPSLFEIEAEYMNTGGTDYSVTIDAEMVVAYPWLANDIVLQVALTESHIPENWLGQTEVNFVCRDMIPTDAGTSMDFAGSTTQTVTLDFTIPAAFVMSNIELIVFIQDNTTMEILQGSEALFIDGINELSSENQIAVYPNPATDYVNISADMDIQSITVYNNVGQVISVETVESNLYKINTSSYETGLYFIQLETEEGMISKRVIIE